MRFLWLVLATISMLQGCATVGEINAKAQYGLYKDREYRVRVTSTNENDDSFMFVQRATLAKRAIEKSATSSGLRYEDIVKPGNKVAMVMADERFALSKGAARWTAQYDPAKHSLERGDIVTCGISPAMFEIASREVIKPGDVPEVRTLVCKHSDEECLNDPKRGGTLGVILKNGTAKNGSSHFFFRMEAEAEE